ncbi:pre-mRNA-splicing factor rse1, partial [Elasticomyces elasticus]
KLETALRAEDAGALIGRDHLAFRSYYAPVKSVVDGDLCERFFALGAAEKAMVAGVMGKRVSEMEKKIAEMRTRVAY